MTTDNCVPDLLAIEVPVGGRVMVVSDLRLGREATASSSSAVADLAQAIDAWEGPGVLIFAGGLFDLLTNCPVQPAAALSSHPKLAAALTAFRTADTRRIVCLPGSRDGRLAWDDKARRAVTDQLGAEVALAAELQVATGAGLRRVRVEPGQRFDPRFAPGDPRSPTDTPLGLHVLTELMPTLPGYATWLSGTEELRAQADLPRFLVSRLTYRRLAKHAWWLVIPFLMAVALKIPIVYATAARGPIHGTGVRSWGGRLALLGLTTVLDLVLVAVAGYYVSRRAWAEMGTVAIGERGLDANDPARDTARDLVTGGYAGLVTGHTLQPELAHLGTGFYANAGGATEVLDEVPGRLGLPPVFLPFRLLSWIELEAGAELHVRLLHSRIEVPGASLVERLAARRQAQADARPVVVGAFPAGHPWPPVADPVRRQRRVRRWAAVAIAVAGVLDLLSGLTPPLRERLDTVLHVVPLGVPETASALVTLAGLGLLLLARGIRRGQRHAWSVSLGLLGWTVLLHIIKGVDLEESILAALVAVYLVYNRDSFRAASDRPSQRQAARAVAVGGLGVVALATAVVEVVTGTRRRGGRIAFPRAVEAVTERLIGIRHVALPHRLDMVLTPSMEALAAGLAATVVWLAFRPVVARHHADAGTGLTKAREIVHAYGQGTLDYFALRTDKQYFFNGSSLVAYAVYSGVCLVSPDPIGPESERDQVWKAFRAFADEHGWTLAVLGAGEDWLPTYRASGMHDLYVGDEAVVDVSRFSLDGGKNKGLRQAVNRIAKYGYTISFHDPCTIDPSVREQLRAVMTKSRRGDVERGFSMTLGRIFDPADQGMLLAVAHDPSGEAVAFCQYVPAAGIDGYSLDLMRRDDGEHPNGLIDFVVVRTIEHLRASGRRGLGLNFATMRAVLAGEAGDSLTQRVERWMLKRMSGSMQIESLWRFNAKYDPDWQPRYAVYDSPEHMVPAAMAIARAESFWELPLIGRFLVPGGQDGSIDAGGAPSEGSPAVAGPDAPSEGSPAAAGQPKSVRTAGWPSSPGG